MQHVLPFVISHSSQVRCTLEHDEQTPLSDILLLTSLDRRQQELGGSGHMSVALHVCTLLLPAAGQPLPCNLDRRRILQLLQFLPDHLQSCYVV